MGWDLAVSTISLYTVDHGVSPALELVIEIAGNPAADNGPVAIVQLIVSDPALNTPFG